MTCVTLSSTGPVEALSGWSGNKPGFGSGIVMSVRSTTSDCAAKHAPLGGSGGMPPQENFEFLVFVNHILKQF